MTTILDDAVDWLNETLDAECGVSIVYSRGASSVPLLAAVGQTNFESDSEFGVLKIESRDFLVTTSRFAVTGFSEPARGDRIVETQGSSTVTHEVLDMPGIPPFAYDNTRRRLRIHTKRITTT